MKKLIYLLPIIALCSSQAFALDMKKAHEIVAQADKALKGTAAQKEQAQADLTKLEDELLELSSWDDETNRLHNKINALQGQLRAGGHF